MKRDWCDIIIIAAAQFSVLRNANFSLSLRRGRFQAHTTTNSQKKAIKHSN